MGCDAVDACFEVRLERRFGHIDTSRQVGYVERFEQVAFG